MNFVFIADFIYPTVCGGAEHNDKVMLEFLKKNGHTIEIYDSMSITLDALRKIDKENKFIISNFGLLHQDKINFIQDNFEYIIYEHDHKYLIHRHQRKML
jgi:organic radical activating enzyme